MNAPQLLAILALAATLVAPNAAFAEKKKSFKVPVSFCPSAASIAAKVEYCEDNDQFIKKGDDCLTKLENEIKATAGAMSAGFVKGDEQKQSKDFNAAAMDYKFTTQAIDYLIATANLAISEVSLYSGALVEPEDADEEDVNEGKPEKFKMSVQCYGDSKESLDGLVADFNVVLTNLKNMKKATEANAATSSAHEAGVQESSSEQVIVNGKGASGPVPSGKSKNSQSDITGTQPKKK